MLVIGGLVGELKEIYSAIIVPYLYIGKLLTQFEAADNWTKLLFAFLCILFYVSVISFIPLLIAKDWSRAEKASPAPEIMLYTEEISAAMEVIERPEVTEMEIMDKAAAAAVQHIVYMDKLWKLMVSYSQNLGGGGRDGSSRSGA